MNDDWRVQVTCPTTATAAGLNETLREGEFQQNMQDSAGERVVVSLDGHELFLYAPRGNRLSGPPRPSRRPSRARA